MKRDETSAFDYSALVEAALRGVVRQVLARIVEDGLPGQHHVYITFRTADPGVELPETLLARYPTDITIVLQYEFWDLKVDDDGFEVTLKFGGLPQRLRVPFDAVTVFADPSVEFGLQFSAPDAPETAVDETVEPTPIAPVEKLPRPTAEAPNGGGGEVVTLDRFRKK